MLANLTRAAAAVALVAPALVRAQHSAAASRQPAAATRATATLPVGRYAAVVTAADTRAADAAGNEGAWELTLSGAGATRTYRVTNTGHPIGTGTFAVAGTGVTVTDDSEACRGSASGRYAWTAVADTLRLVAKGDGCEPRRFVLAGRPWVRRP